MKRSKGHARCIVVQLDSTWAVLFTACMLTQSYCARVPKS
jgi:hypothetical protein